MYLGCCRWEYVQLQSGDDSIWESFPHVLESMEGARRYISAFQAPLQELSTLSPAQIHTLRACSLLVIPPPPERVPPQGGFPTDLSELNLSAGLPWYKTLWQACSHCHPIWAVIWASQLWPYSSY